MLRESHDFADGWQIRGGRQVAAIYERLKLCQEALTDLREIDRFLEQRVGRGAIQLVQQQEGLDQVGETPGLARGLLRRGFILVAAAFTAQRHFQMARKSLQGCAQFMGGRRIEPPSGFCRFADSRQQRVQRSDQFHDFRVVGRDCQTQVQTVRRLRLTRLLGEREYGREGPTDQPPGSEARCQHHAELIAASSPVSRRSSNSFLRQ